MLVDLEKILLFLSKEYTKFKPLIFTRETPPDPRLKSSEFCARTLPTQHRSEWQTLTNRYVDLILSNTVNNYRHPIGTL